MSDTRRPGAGIAGIGVKRLGKRNKGSDAWRALSNKSPDRALDRWAELPERERAALEREAYGHDLAPIRPGGFLEMRPCRVKESD